MNKKTKKYLTIWVICLALFLISLYVGGVQNGPFNENPSLIKNIAFLSLFVSIIVGTLSFLTFIYRFVESNVGNGVHHNKSKTIIFFILAAPIFPLYALVSLIKSFFQNRPKMKDLRWLMLGVTIMVLIPVWLLAYVVTYFVSTDELLLGTRYQISNSENTDSMAPSFPGGSLHKYYPYKNVFYKINREWSHKFQRGDTISFSNSITNGLIDKAYKKGKYEFFKRIIALPGETVELRGGAVFVNDKPLVEPYILEPNSTFAFPNEYLAIKKLGINGLFLQECQKIIVPENKLFVLGDNRKNSEDSRAIGFVSFDDVHGYLSLEDQKKPFYEGVNLISYSDKWRDASKDYENLLKTKNLSCTTRILE